MSTIKTPIIFIVGPSGAGKSDAAFETAQRLGGEIVSCDAMQVYREVSVACDKPSLDTRKKIPHHMLDVVSVTQEFNAAVFRQLALAAIMEIRGRGKTPIVCGGSGMYMAFLLDGIFEVSAKDEGLRRRLQEEIHEQGTSVLHGRLAALDPAAAAKIHPHDAQRIVRGLEVALTVGRPLSEVQKERQGLWGQVPLRVFGLDRPRKELYERVEARVEQMFEHGLVDEVRALSGRTLSRTACAIIGIPEVTGYLKGEYDLARAKYLMKLNTRHYVKRQLTWFRRDQRVQWVEAGTEMPL
ncbi:MAG: tRNA (adenosine(37)-N6)-dimethylallyltransferase MiaA [Candidatus Omnitrophica bacterium]|nr:tRNA (adenosine(37)-N6)-dimethylallyltransferase MiaA [Candidatus Omnitrophota bacterium]